MSPSISQKELDKLRHKQGIYSQLRQSPKAQKVLRDSVTELIEKVFREWARMHVGCTKELEEKSWQIFNKILQKNL